MSKQTKRRPSSPYTEPFGDTFEEFELEVKRVGGRRRSQNEVRGTLMIVEEDDVAVQSERKARGRGRSNVVS